MSLLFLFVINRTDKCLRSIEDLRARPHEGQLMRTYECYLLDTQGHLAPAQVIECFDDGEACLRAGKILADKAPNYSRVAV